MTLFDYGAPKRFRRIRLSFSIGTLNGFSDPKQEMAELAKCLPGALASLFVRIREVPVE